jgi:hypothetical protein
MRAPSSLRAERSTCTDDIATCSTAGFTVLAACMGRLRVPRCRPRLVVFLVGMVGQQTAVEAPTERLAVSLLWLLGKWCYSTTRPCLLRNVCHAYLSELQPTE